MFECAGIRGCPIHRQSCEPWPINSRLDDRNYQREKRSSKGLLQVCLGLGGGMGDWESARQKVHLKLVAFWKAAHGRSVL
jgi:hypothetical protein